jgi:hypothetical protein
LFVIGSMSIIKSDNFKKNQKNLMFVICATLIIICPTTTNQLLSSP